MEPLIAPVAPVTPAPIVEAPIAPAPIIEAPVTPAAKPAFEGLQILGVKAEYLVLGLISVMVASYTMSILHYRKSIKTSNTIENLQNQIDQLKLSINTKAK